MLFQGGWIVFTGQPCNDLYVWADYFGEDLHYAWKLEYLRAHYLLLEGYFWSKRLKNNNKDLLFIDL